MNARHPLSFITADPDVDAAEHGDYMQAEQDAYKAMLAEAEQQAPLIVLGHLQALQQPGDWFKASICTGVLWSPDEMLSWGIEKDDDLKDALAELMTGPAAAKVRELMAKQYGRDYALDIVLAHKEARH